MEKDSKKIICKDVHGKEYEIAVGQLSFRPSVYGVIIQDGKAFLSKQWGDGYDFPGGGIELGETIEEALKREVKEETGLEVKVGEIIAVENSFLKFQSDGRYVQSILMYYACEVVGGEISTEFFDAYEKEYADKPEWIGLDEIEKIKFYNPVDSVKIIKTAKRMECPRRFANPL